MYDGYYQPQGMATPQDTGLAFDMPDDAKGAAFSVAFVLVMGAVILTLLKRSGFRAMVAVGRS